MSNAAHSVNLRWLYLPCNDLAAMRRFYGELVGLTETSFHDDEKFNWLCYKCSGLELVFTRSAQPIPVAAGWAEQPGWAGGDQPRVSWSIHISPERYAATVAALQEAGVPAFFEQPKWCQDSYWSFPVLDPMGNTAEVYSEPGSKVESTQWPGT